MRALVLLLALAACGSRAYVPHDSAPAYAPDGPPSLTLFTQDGGPDGAGVHTALMISGSERVILDPAGSFGGPGIAVVADMIVNVTPEVLTLYQAYEARAGYELVAQTVTVTPEVAERALARAHAQPDLAPGSCTRTIAGLIDSLPGFDGLQGTLFPDMLRQRFGRLPGVTQVIWQEDDFTIPARVLASHNTRFDEACITLE